MSGWPNWLYYLFSLVVRGMLIPVVLPYRFYNWLTGTWFMSLNLYGFKYPYGFSIAFNLVGFMVLLTITANERSIYIQPYRIGYWGMRYNRTSFKYKLHCFTRRIKYGEYLIGLFEVSGHHEKYWTWYWPRKQNFINQFKNKEKK